MDWHNVRDMPIHHSTYIKTQDEINTIISYCINDVASTKQVMMLSKEQIMLRKALTNEYNINLYSASEPRISKELFLHFLSAKTGIKKYDLKQMRTRRTEIRVADIILPYVNFKRKEFNNLHDKFKSLVIDPQNLKGAFKYSINHKGVKTDFGFGGVHGATKAGIYEAKDGMIIMTSDVTSFYPNLAIKNKFHPEHLPQKEFGDLYEWFFEERKKIPKTDPKNYVYKIILNSTYGLTGDENSFLYDPKMTMQITINGQLQLSMLYEMLCLEIPEGIPLMQNTDGLEMMIPTSAISTYMDVCAKWEKITQLNLEHDEYSKMIIADVNNYMAVYKNGKVKSKGKYEWEDLEKKKVAIFHKNKSFLIIPKAVYAYFVYGTLPEEFLAQNRSVYDYCGGIKAKGGWYYEERSLVNGELVTNKLQKIVRYYVTKSGTKIMKCHPDGREMQVEAGEWMQKIANEIDPNMSYEAYDIDTEYYLENIYKQIEQINKVKLSSFTQLSLF
jgi:hypothetical protein